MGFCGSSFILVVPMYQEVKAVLKQLAKNKEDKKAGEEMQPLYKNGLNSNGLPKHTFTAFQSTNKTGENSKLHTFIGLSMLAILSCRQNIRILIELG